MDEREHPISRLAAPALLLGADGMLGRAWTEWLQSRSIEFHAPGLNEVDFTKPDTIDAVASRPWGVVINCAAMTDVDGAESNRALAFQLNAAAPGRIAEVCAKSGALLVHYSTDYVFDGKARSPYAIDHPRRPIGAYAQSKAGGEEAIEASGARFLIIRTSWLYAPWGKNFVRTIRNLVLARPEIRVVDDQRGRPTSAEHLVRASARLAATGATGFRHVTDGGECTWYGLACEIAARTPGAGVVRPCTTAEFPRPAPRPAYSVLDLTETERALGPMPEWRTNLADVLNRLES